MENSVADFLNRWNTEKVNLSCMDFYDGFPPEKVNQDTVALLHVCDWRVKLFFSPTGTILYFGENVWESSKP